MRKTIHNLIRPYHPWRDIKFDELAEIYTSMSLRSFGFGVIGIFIPVFLYNSGVTLQGVFLFYGLFFLLRVPLSIVAALTVARIGPKHTIAMSTIVIITFFGMLLSYDAVGWPLLFLALIFTIANGLFFIAYNVDFSKINHKKHGGKELGWLYIFERIGSALGPIVGGLVANLIAPEATIVLAILVLLGSLVPLFFSNEPVRIHQKITFRGFRSHLRAGEFIAVSSFNVQNVANNVLWPLLIAVLIFTDDTYVKLGGIIGLSMAVSIFSAHMYGKFLDNRKGSALLRYGVVMNFVLNGSKAIVSSSGGVVAVGALGEPVVLAYRMPIVKQLYEGADNVEGYRIVYLAWAEMITALTKAVYCFSLLFASYYFDPLNVLRASFLVIPFVGLFMLPQRFSSKKRV